MATGLWLEENVLVLRIYTLEHLRVKGYNVCNLFLNGSTKVYNKVNEARCSPLVFPGKGEFFILFLQLFKSF